MFDFMLLRVFSSPEFLIALGTDVNGRDIIVLLLGGRHGREGEKVQTACEEKGGPYLY